MAGFKDNALERRNASLAAKQALLQKFKTQPSLDDPELQARLAERAKIAEAREQRVAERRVAQAAEQARLAAIAEQENAARLAAEAEALVKQAEQVQRDEEIRAERKALRDAKYAARKARTRR